MYWEHSVHGMCLHGVVVTMTVMAVRHQSTNFLVEIILPRLLTDLQKLNPNGLPVCSGSFPEKFTCLLLREGE